MEPSSLELYRKLYLARRAEEAIIRYYPEDDMKTPMHMSLGQEVIPVAVCDALRPDDYVFSSYRSHSTFIAKTEDTDAFFGELYGRVLGGAHGKAGSMHLSAPEKMHMGSSAIVASSIPVAVGAAYGAKAQRNGRIACVFFGDGAMDEGVFWESVNVAALMELPVLFVCEDNGWAVHTPIEKRHAYRSATEAVRPFGAATFECSSPDPEEVRRVSAEAIASARSGTPTFFLVKCYRWLEHVGINYDFNAGYRDEAEFRRWKENDSVKLQRERLLATGVPEATIAALERTIDERVEQSVRRAKASPPPAPAELYAGVLK